LALTLDPSGVFLLSDGKFNGGAARLIEWLPIEHNPSAAEVIDRYNYAGAPVHTIAFVDRSSRPRMEELAQLTGGEHRFVSALDLCRPKPGSATDEKYRRRMLLSLAQSLELQGKYTAAIRRYREIAKQNPGTEEAKMAVQRAEALDTP
jgi:hypothetical protein